MPRAALPHRADAQPAPGPRPRFPSLFGLAPCGVYPATGITASAVRSYRTFSPLPLHETAPKSCPTQWRYVFCGTSRPRALKPASRTLSGTLPCGVRTFLSRQPLLAQGLPAATARSSCQAPVYRESVFPPPIRSFHTAFDPSAIKIAGRVAQPTRHPRGFL